MTPIDPNQPQFQRLARNAQFLAYRGGAPNPVTKSLFLILLVPFGLIFILGLCFELAIQFGLVKPAHKSNTPVEENWKPRMYSSSQETLHETIGNA